MNTEELNSLLEKYYKGESTEEEEMHLREYFLENNIPGGFDAEREIFRYYNLSIDIPEPTDGFEDRIIAAIDDIEAEIQPSRFRRIIRPVISVAAGLLILTASYFFIIHRSTPVDTYTDPEIAYAETMKILMEVSSKLNHGVQTLEPIEKINEYTALSFETINKSTSKVEKRLMPLNHIQQNTGNSNISYRNKKQ